MGTKESLNERDRTGDSDSLKIDGKTVRAPQWLIVAVILGVFALGGLTVEARLKLDTLAKSSEQSELKIQEHEVKITEMSLKKTMLEKRISEYESANGQLINVITNKLERISNNQIKMCAKFNISCAD